MTIAHLEPHLTCDTIGRGANIRGTHGEAFWFAALRVDALAFREPLCGSDYEIVSPVSPAVTKHTSKIRQRSFARGAGAATAGFPYRFRQIPASRTDDQLRASRIHRFDCRFHVPWRRAETAVVPVAFCARVGLLDGRVRLDAFITESGVPWVWQRYGLQIWTLLS